MTKRNSKSSLGVPASSNYRGPRISIEGDENDEEEPDTPVSMPGNAGHTPCASLRSSQLDEPGHTPCASLRPLQLIEFSDDRRLSSGELSQQGEQESRSDQKGDLEKCK